MIADPNSSSYIQDSAHLLVGTLVNKNSDYAPSGEFSNFTKAAEFVGVTEFEAIMIQVGIKLTRINSLMEPGKVATNEPLKDSLLDLAGYAIIAHAYLEKEES